MTLARRLAAAVAITLSATVAQANTVGDAGKLVDAALAEIKSKGVDGAIREFNSNAGGRWSQGGLYVVVVRFSYPPDSRRTGRPLRLVLSNAASPPRHLGRSRRGSCYEPVSACRARSSTSAPSPSSKPRPGCQPRRVRARCQGRRRAAHAASSKPTLTLPSAHSTTGLLMTLG